MIRLWNHCVGRALFLAFGFVLLTNATVLAQHDGAITAPSANAIVSGTVTVEGFAVHPTFRKWQLDLLLGGDAGQATFLALGEKPVVAPSQLLIWDTTPYPDGEHVLRLRVVHSNLNYEEIFTPIVIMNGEAPPLVEKPEIAEVETKPDSPPQEKVEATPVVFRTDAPPDGERWIEVIVSEQKLIAWQGDTPVFETIVSTGKRGFETIPGEFRIYVKYEKTRMRGPGYDTPDVPWTMYYHRGFAIHGAYWHNNFGTPVSHGCVNLRVPEAKALYDWASVGTRVVVRP
ncbi:MAG: L,D-transpeptidase [Caldilinea sp.]|nr:L,D-transpeptidase [Caldilinea sp.]MDW8441334.1 L,D-transpeptidase [Caldilineaceae bacterium]